MTRTAKFALALAAAAVVAPLTNAVAGSNTGSINVSATVNKNCVLTTGAIAFGSYDPVGANASAALNQSSTGMTVACTKGTAYTVTLNQGSNGTATQRFMKDTGGNSLQYEIYSDSGHTTVWNTTNTVTGTAANNSQVSLTAYGQIPAASAQPAAVAPSAAGGYTDSVTATVTF